MFKQKINDSAVMKFGFLGGIAEAVYVFLVVSLMQILDSSVSKPENPIVVGMLVLLLLVFSAAVSGILVFGYPAYLALQKKYAEALATVIVTLAVLAIVGIGVFILVSII